MLQSVIGTAVINTHTRATQAPRTCRLVAHECNFHEEHLFRFEGRAARASTGVGDEEGRHSTEMSKLPSRKNLSIAVPPPRTSSSASSSRSGEMRTPSSALASVLNRALGLRGPDARPGSPINKALTRSRSERESGHEHRSPPCLPATSGHVTRYWNEHEDTARAPDAAARDKPGRAQSATRTRSAVYERMLSNTREPPPTPISCKPHQTKGGTRDPYRSHEATDTERRVRLTEASSGKATAAATLRYEAGAKGPLEHEELMKLRQENEDLRAQLRRESRDHLTERPRTALPEPHPVDGFTVLGMRYKEVWGTRSKRTRAVDGDCDGDFQACAEPSTSRTVAPRPTHAYFTRTASAEMLARMDGMGI